MSRAGSEPANWDAVETAARIRSGEVSAREILRGAIARAESASPLGALVTPTFERALEAAETLGSGALAGVPSALKDLLQVAGVRTTWGSQAIGDYVSKKSDPFVRRFEDAGLVSLGKTATPEFGLTATTEPLGRDPCRNPWDPRRITGGSSGGSAALVAAGVIPIASASDGGGSIRIPAACCGLVGFKPSRLRSDMLGSNLLPVNIACDGVLTRSVRDTIAFFDAVESGRPPRKIDAIGAVRAKPARRIRVGVFVNAPLGLPVHPEVQAAVRAAAATCAALGHHVEEIDVPFAASVVEDFQRYWAYVAWAQVRFGKIATHRGFDARRVEPWTAAMAAAFTGARWAAFGAIRRLRRFGEVYDAVLQDYPVLVCPTVAAPAPVIGHLATDLPFELVFGRVEAFAGFTCIQNVAGAPAISLPLGQSTEGLPIGVQFATARGEDRLLLELARELESAAPWQPTAPSDRWRSAV
ncbi:MAG: amidase [Myxococcales bacterium]|nr:amidase [Myxococcales bacterium]